MPFGTDMFVYVDSRKRPKGFEFFCRESETGGWMAFLHNICFCHDRFAGVVNLLNFFQEFAPRAPRSEYS